MKSSDATIKTDASTTIAKFVAQEGLKNVSVIGQAVIKNAQIGSDTGFDRQPENKTGKGESKDNAAQTSGGGGGGGGGTGTVSSNTSSSNVEFLAKASFVGALTSDLKVKVGGTYINNYTLFFNGEALVMTTNGIITTVNNVFYDFSKIKIKYDSQYMTDTDSKMGTW